MAATVLEPQKKKTRLMTEGSIWKSILLFSVPLILGNLLQQLYNTADSIIVGNFVGSNALAAVGSSGSPIFLLIGFSQGIAVGAGVVVAQYLGAKDREDAQRAVHTALALAVVLGLILTIGRHPCQPYPAHGHGYPGGGAGGRGDLYADLLRRCAVQRRVQHGGGHPECGGQLPAVAALSGHRIGYEHPPRPRAHRGAADGCGRCGHRHRHQPAGFLCAGTALFDAGPGRLPRDGQRDPGARQNGRPHHQVGLPTGIQNMVISLSNILVQASVNGYGAAAMAGFAAI
mgnify:CR=1 FL=1